MFDHDGMSIFGQSFIALRISRERLGATPNLQDNFTRTIGRYRNRDTTHHPGQVFIHRNVEPLIPILAIVMCKAMR